VVPLVRDSWIKYMERYYTVVFIGIDPKFIREWSEIVVDNAVRSLGDYFSRSKL